MAELLPFREELLMIKGYVSAMALRMGMKLSKVSLVEGKTLGCLDSHLLKMSSRGCNVSTVIHQADYDNFEKNGDCYWLEIRVRETLSRLQLLLEACD